MWMVRLLGKAKEDQRRQFAEVRMVTIKERQPSLFLSSLIRQRLKPLHVGKLFVWQLIYILIEYALHQIVLRS
jgi:uncharacterized membrane protein (DUF106 family)